MPTAPCSKAQLPKGAGQVGLTLVVASLLALSACKKADTGFESLEGSPYAPGTFAAQDGSVDGLTVGHRLTAAGEHELALKAYTRAAAEQGITVDVLSAIGSANLQLGRLGQAEKLLRKATQLDVNFAPAWNNLGVVLMETGQVNEAARVFRIAFGLDRGQSAEIRENLRLALANLDNPDYDPANNDTFSLVRRGSGDYLLLSEI
ncbi:tetratricopeptide repeat protein [Aliiroseovarius sp. F20344]|uniref:tetratricopeptide repeat protein n=1 Tax=Aliiroseovarius sp. F20344 TaxID=2926414 RepID=UPI001FF6D644|nr:tetratricopeptide repeat protein [Aliiroseovarius sp. F20344]MCK0142378.1 tetratricopeptide repeat protein [Aliiroseovarius sp. F20344]